MAVNLSVKNVPDELARRLRDRAAANHRSLQRELVSILEQAVGGVSSASERRDDAVSGTGHRPVEEFLAELREIFPEVRRGGPSSVELVRQMREARDGRVASRPSRRAP